MLLNLLIKPLIYLSKAIGFDRLQFYRVNIMSASFIVILLLEFLTLRILRKNKVGNILDIQKVEAKFSMEIL